MGLFIKSKKVEQYIPIQKDIENYIFTKLNLLNEQLRNEYVFFNSKGAHVASLAYKAVIDPHMCIDVTGFCSKPNWKIMAESRGKIPVLYQLSINYKMYGAYYHIEEIEKNKRIKEECQLVPLDWFTEERAWIGYYAPEILTDVHNRLRQLATEVNQYIKYKHPGVNAYVTAEYHSNYSDKPYKIEYYRKERANPEQYREHFMDAGFDEVLQNMQIHHLTAEQYAKTPGAFTSFMGKDRFQC